jgi:hypothetical protein
MTPTIHFSLFTFHSSFTFKTFKKMSVVSGAITEFLNLKGTEFIKNIYAMPQLASLVRNYPGVDGKLTMPTANIDKYLLRGYDGKAEADADTVVFEPVNMSTTMHKFFLPMDLGDETFRAYKNFLKGSGKSSDDYSVVQYFADDAQIKEKMAAEIDEAGFTGKAIYAPEDGKAITETVNGFRRIIKNAAALNKVHVETIDETNAVAKITKLYKTCPAPLQQMGVAIICGYNTYNNYRDNFFTDRKANPASEDFINNSTYMGTRFHLGAGKSYIIPFAGMGDDDAVFLTPLTNLAYLFDVESAVRNFRVQEIGFQHHLLTRLPIGFGVRKMSPRMVICNDQLIAKS